MRLLLLSCICGAALLGATPMLSSSGEAMMRKLTDEVARLTNTGEITRPEKDETDFGRRLLETWKTAGVELPMPEDQITRLRKGEKRLSAKPEVELPANMRFTGFLQYSNIDGNIRLPYGFYTFSQKDGLNRKLYKNLEACINFGGAYAGNRLYGLSNITLPVGGTTNYTVLYYQWDTDTWQLTADPVSNRNNLVTAGADFDPVSKNIYGITFGKKGKTMLSIIDYENISIKEVGDLDPVCAEICAFAINNEGIGYAIDRTATLFKINLSSAAPEKIGSLDFEFKGALQSMTFDPRTGKLYLAASEGDLANGEMYGRLCEVCLKDATTKLVGYLPEAEEYTMLHVIYDPDSNAPGAITDLTANYSDESMNGVLTFTMPTATFGGSTLSGTVDYAIYVNDSDTPAVTGSATAGEKVTSDIKATEGRTKYVVVLSNEAGEGERNAIESWGGMDTPAIVKATASEIEGNVTISWEAGGAHGGYVSLEGVRYNISRLPGDTPIGEKVEGTTFTDNISALPNGAFAYSIVPVRGDSCLQGMKTAFVYGGAPRSLPYVQDFETSDAVYDFFMINNNEGGWTITPDWYFEGAMTYNDSPYSDSDAWALTPGLAFEEGYTYIIDFKASRAQFTEYLSIGIGEGYNTSNYEVILDRHPVDVIFFDGTDSIQLVYECKKTGTYHVGFHAVSPRNQSNLRIHEMSVKAGLPVKAPAAVTDLTATPGNNGDLTATISFTAPVLTVGGASFDNISGITVSREGTDSPIAKLTDVTPGKRYSITDEEAMNGKLTYKVTAWNEYGEGETAFTNAYVGIDTPMPPTNITVTDNFDGSFTINWDESEEGVNGGFVELKELTYNLYYYNEGTLTALASDIEDTSYIVKGLPTDGDQTFLPLFISAVNDLGESKQGSVPVISLGTPYTVPFMEGFAELTGIWLPEGQTVKWGIYGGMSCDGDNFLMGATPYEQNAKGGLRSGKFSLKGIANPKMAFSFYSVPGVDNTISLSVSKEGGATEEILSIPFKTLDGSEGWRVCLVDLSPFADLAYINFIFEVSLNDENCPFIYLDDINVRDVPEHNLYTSVVPQNRVTAGEKARIDVTVHNVGTNIENNYTVDIYVNNTLHTTLNGTQLRPFQRGLLTCEYSVPAISPELTSVKAILIDSDDSIEDDNTSEATIKVVAPMLETATGLTADNNNETVTLNWEAPDKSSVVTDSFEGYESFAYEGFGNWEVIDNDGVRTSKILSNYYPGVGNPAAFFTVDFSSLGYDVEGTEFAGHTGESFIACVRPANNQNDDWVISLELSGEPQTISLFVKSMGAVFNDSFEILYSEGGRNIEDFISTGTLFEPSSSWEEFTAELPAGAKYFAIHCNSYYGGMLMIDDVTYEAEARELTGYNIYRNDELIASVNADTLSYSEPTPAQATSYKVTALYTIGESAPCEEVTVTSIAMLNAIGVSMSIQNGILDITGAEGYKVEVVSVDGKVIFNGIATADIKLPVCNGLYVITLGDSSVKLLAD